MEENVPQDIQTVPLDYKEYSVEEMLERAEGFHLDIQRRRTVRGYSDRPVAREVIEACIRAAGSAPSGANRQPWHFVAIQDPALKSKIRSAAEQEEREFYEHRAPDDWLEALEPFGTDQHKPFLETAPWLIAIFAELHGVEKDGQKVKNYYVNESVGIATGFLITGLHRAGLVTLTHTPSPMAFLRDILGRPKRERAFLLLVVGYPEEGTRVPDIVKKDLEEIATFI